MISYKRFANLRLSDYLIGDMRAESVSDWEFLNLKWIGHTIGFTQWLRLESDPNVVRCISLDFVALPSIVLRNILSALELCVERGMSQSQVEAVLDRPTKLTQMNGKIRGYFRLAGKEPYDVICSFGKAEGLVFLTVTRNS